MRFEDVDAESCMHGVALDVADELREQIRSTYEDMHHRNQQIGGGMANVALAGLTVVWMECVHATMGTLDSESAISLLRDMRPEDKEAAREMRMAVRDFLRRSHWLPKRRAK